MSLENKKSLNVLLIDDSEVDSFLTIDELETSDLIGNLTLISHPNLALEYLLDVSDRFELPDLILLDISMPILDGFEFMDELREWKLFKKDLPFKVFILTNSNLDQDRQIVKKEKAISEFIEKPIKKAVIERLIQKHFGLD